MKIKKNDIVKVMTGKDKGKTGKVLIVMPSVSKVIVEGINFAKKHQRRTQKDPQGGVIQKESPINISNIMLMCPRCNRPARIGYSIMTDGTKARICKKCEEIL